MNPLAKELNNLLEGTAAGSMLSEFGRRFFFPKGIISQSAEASQKAYRFNATIGMATSGSVPMNISSVRRLMPELSEQELFPYAPTAGVMELRELWKKEMDRKNPSLIGKPTSLPVVTTGLTHGIAVTADLFVNPGDTVIVPDMFWGNYRLIVEHRICGKLETFTFFTEEGGLNISGMEKALRSGDPGKCILMLNFPNNPTGYSPTAAEANQIVSLLHALAEEGRKILVILDDAYFGLFYEEDTYKESLFGLLADLHEHIVAVKVDGITKEELAWGFRVGFITYGAKGMSEACYDALTKKTMGAVRSSISNSNKIAQSLIVRAMKDPEYAKQKDEACDVLQKRYRRVREVLRTYAPDDPIQPLPFNSGYFMTFVCRGDSELLRTRLLDSYGIGSISIPEKYLRIAFSSVDLEDIEELYTTIRTAAKEAFQ